MSHDHSHQGCAQCACHNPLWTTFSKKLSGLSPALSNDENNVQSPEALQPTTTVMYSGGIIRPVINGGAETVEAIGFHDGKVAVVGSEVEVSAKMQNLGLAPDNHIVLEGKQTLLPGLIEPHVHIVPTALTMGWLDLGPYIGQDLIPNYDCNYLKDKLSNKGAELDNKDKLELDKALKEKDWILGVGVDPALMPFRKDDSGDKQLVELNIQMLDQTVPDRAVYLISASMHTAYINTVALDLIVDTLPIEEQGAFRDKVENQGALQELEQMTYGFEAIPQQQKDQINLELNQHIESIFDTANKRGVTTMFEAGMRFESVGENGKVQSKMISTLEDFRETHPHNVRVGYALLCATQHDADALCGYKPLTEKDMGNLFQSAVKLVSDGSNQGLTGYQSTPYCCEPENNCGIFNFSYHSSDPIDPDKPDYQKLVTTIVEKDWPVLIHANGDKAVDYALDVYETALKGSSGLDKRHRIEHCSILSHDSADKMQSLGISPSFLIGHVGYWGYAFNEVIFKEKALLLDRCRTMLDKGARITLHSDLSVTPLGPLRMMEQAVTRVMEKAPKPIPLNESECISREEALRAITLDAAWQCHVDQWIGSLAQGKLADYVILEDDPITLDASKKIRDIGVFQTWVGGKLRYVGNFEQKPAHCSERKLEQVEGYANADVMPA
ncbi:amidohydrolase [Photobacterium kasasachensis]|uniref:amidohydrolase n=1 Tax=Photobacterium kasasachensis TaxID=2910240 RepID=UPI003D0D08FA